MLTANMTSPARPAKRDALRWLLPAAILLAMLIGGSSRADVLPLLILRPLSALLLVFGVYCYGGAAWRQSPALMALALGVVLLAVAHVVPLPPVLWSMLPGRDVIVQTYEVAAMPLPWLSLSMSPAGAWNALFSLMLPLAVLILALAAKPDDRVRALKWVMVIALISGFIGLLQILGPPRGPLYFYKVTNAGAAVGFFANRNHQAVLMASLFPLLATYAALADNSRGRLQLHRAIAIAAAAFIAPMILVTGSRNGLVLGAVGLVLAVWVYGKGTEKPAVKSATMRWRQWSPIAVVAALVGLSLLTIVASRGVAFQRLVDLDASQDLRLKALPTVVRIVGDTFPWGSGMGSFDEVYRHYEPGQLLSPNYFNHAHNDWLEVVMTGGLPAIFLALVAIVYFLLVLVAVLKQKERGSSHRRRLISARCAIVILLLLAIGSIAEYPARTPSLAVLGVLCAAILTGVRKVDMGDSSRDRRAASNRDHDSGEILV
ncbi:MAG: O-antigen ligase family protein [Sphingopyxis sp.]|uniref:O-antigen ligase family protein n=1 Tax=Sphingopyxis sp. TaxID=1908224 RepID=UPI001A50A803|nr:O-antigen ligase family protein [Sphingopyxis sp.]MBL9066199.1 O-antigen ligase family protein [Sphingopyxis sp.]